MDRRAKAAEYFNLQPGQCLHHKDPTLRHTNRARYNLWLIEDLEVMDMTEHRRLHAGELCTDETKEKRANSLKGHTVSEETKEKIAEGNRGKVISDEQKAIISETMKHIDRKGENNGRYGKHCSEETKKKMSEARKKYWENIKNKNSERI